MNHFPVDKRQSFGRMSLEDLNMNGYICIGKLLNMKVYSFFNGEERSVIIIDPNSSKSKKFKIIMRIDLFRVLGNAWFVEEVGIASKYQGFGLAPKAYRFVMQSLNIIMRSGNEQSPGGNYIWNELNKYSDIDIYAIDIKNKYEWYDVESTDHGILECDSLSLYDEDDRFNSNFLIAIPV